MVRIGLVLFMGLSVLTLGFYAVGNMLTRDAVLAELKEAVATQDAQVIADRIDWNELRVFLVEDLTDRLKKSYDSLHIGPPPKSVPVIVDYYVQSEHIALLLALRPGLFPDAPVDSFVHSIGFAGSPMAFQITAGYPLGYEMEGLNAEPALSQRLRAKFVFRLDGWRWTIKEMHVPLILVPPMVYDLSDPALLLPSFYEEQ